jgi:cell division septation protein DedD
LYRQCISGYYHDDVKEGPVEMKKTSTYTSSENVMNTLRNFVVSTLMPAALFLAGCSSSYDSANRQRTEEPVAQTKPADQPAARVEPKPAPADTVSVMVQKTERPTYEPKNPAPAAVDHTSLPTGRFSVQLGAYKMPDNSDRVASLAKERFHLNVYTSYDKNDNLYKVMMGDFSTKDEARSFRDRMVQQFPLDYRDAWVSENPIK